MTARAGKRKTGQKSLRISAESQFAIEVAAALEEQSETAFIETACKEKASAVLSSRGLRLRSLFHAHPGVRRNGELRPPKGKRFRVVAISGELHELMTKHAPKSGFILRTEAGKPATAKAINGWFASLTRLAGVSTAGKAHVLRHTFGTHLAMAGVDLHRIQSLLGHSDQRTTELYARIAGTHAATASDELTRFRARAWRNSGEK